MAEQTTYIKIDRNLKRWRWFKNKNTLIVFLSLLLDANITDHEFEHEIIHRGEVATSLRTLEKTTGLTFQEVRTAILHLKSTGEITTRKSSKYQVITIVNYNEYQDNQQAKQHKNQHSINKQSTSNQQQYKNDKNDKNGKKEYTRARVKVANAPDTPSGNNGLPKPRDEGTADDIPNLYRDMIDNYQAYWDWRNQ